MQVAGGVGSFFWGGGCNNRGFCASYIYGGGRFAVVWGLSVMPHNAEINRITNPYVLEKGYEDF